MLGLIGWLLFVTLLTYMIAWFFDEGFGMHGEVNWFIINFIVVVFFWIIPILIKTLL